MTTDVARDADLIWHKKVTADPTPPGVNVLAQLQFGGSSFSAHGQCLLYGGPQGYSQAQAGRLIVPRQQTNIPGGGGTYSTPEFDILNGNEMLAVVMRKFAPVAGSVQFGGSTPVPGVTGVSYVFEDGPTLGKYQVTFTNNDAADQTIIVAVYGVEVDKSPKGHTDDTLDPSGYGVVAYDGTIRKIAVSTDLVGFGDNVLRVRVNNVAITTITLNALRKVAAVNIPVVEGDYVSVEWSAGGVLNWASATAVIEAT